MGFYADAAKNVGLDLAPAAQFSPGAVSQLWAGTKEREVERKAGTLENHLAREEKTGLAAKNGLRSFHFLIWKHGHLRAFGELHVIGTEDRRQSHEVNAEFSLWTLFKLWWWARGL